MLLQKLVFFLALIAPLSVFAQQSPRVQNDELVRKAKYIGISGQLGNTSIRDFATSPLIYKGLSKTIGLTRTASGSRKFIETGLSYTTGNFSNTFNADFATHTSDAIGTHTVAPNQAQEQRQKWYANRRPGTANRLASHQYRSAK